MAIYDWPDTWDVSRFQMRVLPNTRVHVGPYTPVTQAIDLLGERWFVSMDVPPITDFNVGQAMEAFFDRLLGQVNLVRLWPMHRSLPRGSIYGATGAVSVVNASLASVNVVNASSAPVTVQGGTPIIATAIPQLGNTTSILSFPGKTVYAGDHLGLINGQLVRVMNDAVCDSNGLAAIEFLPRARSAIAATTAIVLNKPTAVFMLKAEGVPIDFRRARVEGLSLEWIEVPQ